MRATPRLAACAASEFPYADVIGTDDPEEFFAHQGDLQ